MQVIDLTIVILALSIKILAGGTLAQLLKATNKEMMTPLSSHEFVAARKLHCLAGPMHSEILASIS